MNPRHRPHLLLLLALVSLTTLGCTERQRIHTTATSQPAVAPFTGLYPTATPIDQPLDIQVIREGNSIILDNRTAHSYGPGQLWLNHQYGSPIDSVPIGRGQPIDLEKFVNHYAEQYPVGTFLQPDRDQHLVMADLYLNGKLHKLYVRLDDDWRQP